MNTPTSLPSEESFEDKKARLLAYMTETQHTDDMYRPDIIQFYIDGVNSCTDNQSIIDLFLSGDYLTPHFVRKPIKF